MTSGFLTIAYGASHYKRMAKALVRSFKRFAPHAKFAVVTDDRDCPLLSEFDEVVDYQPEFGAGLAQKLFIDRYSPFDETLFIDSDGLFYKDPEALWPIYRPYGDFGIRGFRYFNAADGVPGLNNPTRAFLKLHVNSVPFINSGIIYFRKSPDAGMVFTRARSLAADYKALGLLPFGGNAFNDENVWALAMAIEGVPMIEWGAGDAMDMFDHVSQTRGLDIAKPSAEFVTYGRRVDPIFVHYCAGAQHSFFYNREVVRLATVGRAIPLKGFWIELLAYLRTHGFNLSRRSKKIFRRLKIYFGIIGRARHQLG